jgi:ribosomal protein S17
MSQDKQVKLLVGTLERFVDDRTAVVRTERLVLGKRSQKSLRKKFYYLVERGESKAEVGAAIKFKPCRPYSKKKRWVLVDINI